MRDRSVRVADQRVVANEYGIVVNLDNAEVDPLVYLYVDAAAKLHCECSCFCRDLKIVRGACRGVIRSLVIVRCRSNKKMAERLEPSRS